MKPIRIKAFITHKKSLSFKECADSYAMNLANGRFAITDGVTHSYMPAIWSEIVCNTYVENSFMPNNSWFDNYRASKLKEDIGTWKKSVREIESAADDEKAFLYSLSESAYHFGATTLAGFHVDHKNITVDVLGDSTIFQIDENGKITKSFSTVDPERGYDNHPNYIDSNGSIYGTPMSMSVPLNTGFIMLMTDALAEWFVQQAKIETSLSSYLWNIRTNKDFERFIQKLREDRTNPLKDDDCTLLILKISEIDYDGFQIESSDMITYKGISNGCIDYSEVLELLDIYEENMALLNHSTDSMNLTENKWQSCRYLKQCIRTIRKVGLWIANKRVRH